MAYTAWSVVFGEQPSASKWNQLGSNDAFFNSQVGDDFGSGTTSMVWWEELGRTTLGSAGDTITVSSIPARKYLKVLVYTINSGQLSMSFRLNNDSGNNYATKRADNGGAGAAATSQSQVFVSTGADSASMRCTIDIFNPSGVYKNGRFLFWSNYTNVTNAPNFADGAFTYASNTQVTRIDILNSGTGDFDTGSEVIVLGHD